ncbi:hypothetical protein CMQ_4096 [Grosmannia clavigera kw1407]|uniref:Uncharacterized protein n=1 Tax=Grosmannia clavigera (strain kw1407 / UAMH 11150) TaxID=655863 RepID=F0XAI9_GROCL|nr:uncharacterized protein CMQ_4096 [Grosmannia clavigera kw1407]EFX06027.1 hypothetical protein CMQ_4096 [Grosmannia clavigera kw1407]
MNVSAIPSPDNISIDEFEQLLARYPAVLQAVSDAKGAKTGQQTLAELDAFRYQVAPARFGLDEGAQLMTLDDVKQLVAWKLRHGKFRPNLMKLVSSNDEAAVRDAVREALDVYRPPKGGDDRTTSSSLAFRALCRLRGIGPATASLLLAVHDPQHVVFFADAAYAWLCGGPALAPPSKYNDREYEDLSSRAAALQKRLARNGSAADVEKVAYVLLTEGNNNTGGARRRQTKEAETTERPAEPVSKRKRSSAADPERVDSAPPRRSQRVKRA